MKNSLSVWQDTYTWFDWNKFEAAQTAIFWGCHQVDEFEDEVNEITKVFAISRDEWMKI